jgi:hypothetical protein
MTMPGLYSEVYAEAELAYRRERMLARSPRSHRRVHPFHWLRRRTEEQPPARQSGRVGQPVGRPAPASGPHCG